MTLIVNLINYTKIWHKNILFYRFTKMIFRNSISQIRSNCTAPCLQIANMTNNVRDRKSSSAKRKTAELSHRDKQCNENVFYEDAQNMKETESP